MTIEQMRAAVAEHDRQQLAAMTDNDLIEFCPLPDFFSELFRRYAAELQAFLFAHYGPPEVALDAFAESWRRIHNDPQIVAGSVRKSIFTLAANLAVAHENTPHRNPARGMIEV